MSKVSMRRVLGQLVPREWRKPYQQLSALRLVRRWDVIAIGVLTVLAVGFETVGVAMLYPVIDYVSLGGDVGALSARSQFWKVIAEVFSAIGIPISLLALCLIVLLLVLVRQLISVVRTNYLERVRARAGRDLSVQCFDALMHAKGEHLSRIGSGQFAETVNVHCNSGASVLRSFASIWNILVVMVGYGAVLLITAPYATLIAIALGLLLIPTVTYYVRLSRAVSDRLVLGKEGFTQSLIVRHNIWRLIKLSNSAGLETRAIRQQGDQLMRLNLNLTYITGKIQMILVPLQALFAVGALYISVEFLKLSVGTVTLFFVVLLRLLPMLTNIAGIRQHLAVASSVLDRAVNAIEGAKSAREENPGKLPFHGARNWIVFDDVSFNYRDAQLSALANVSLSIPAGKTTAIIGPTGAGKSTLVDLIPRLIEPTAGVIRIDGVSVREFDLASLRAGIGFVTQTPLILNASVADNIRYGLADISSLEVEEACRRARADDFIRALPNGYATVLGEGGSDLSGGQRQRLGLARAFLRRASILILDEPTSALDYETESKIQLALEELRRERRTTLIIIAHRLSTIQMADQIVVLDEGRVIETGAPSKLKHDDGWFRSMLAFDAKTHQQPALSTAAKA